MRSLKRISAAKLLGYPSYKNHGWDHHSRAAYFEPLVIEDGFHEFVLMSFEDYQELRGKADGSAA